MFDVSRILAIPEYDDLPQMGLSKAGLAAIVERGGITEDGTKAKASVLKRADIKGDKKLEDASLSNRGMAITDKKGFQSEGSAAKKIKSAIPLGSSVKGGKVVKGQKPVSGRVIESSKVGKDGFAKASVSIPLKSYKTKSGVTLSEPTKGERIGDYHVSGDSKFGYSVTHIPSGFSVLNSSILEGELGGNDKETAKLAAKKLHEAKIPLPKTFHKMKNSKQPKIQELGRKVLSAIK